MHACRSTLEDPTAELLGSLRLSTLIYGRIELGAPWGLRFADREAASLYVIGRGGAELVVEGGQPIALSAGDVALLPNGPAHVLHDAPGSPLHELGVGECRRSSAAEPLRIGGDGARTMLVAGAFRFGSARRTLLFERLPQVIHISASDPRAAPWLPSTVQLLLAESASKSPGGTVVVSRLVDVLLVQALRSVITGPGCEEHGLRAIADPQIGRALQLVHERPAEAWTVEGLATAVGLSRSGFAARFTTLVGEPPLEYVSRWRMTKAAELLRESDLAMIEVAERVGYGSEAAFNRAFKRWEGTAPATYRRRELRSASA